MTRHRTWIALALQVAALGGLSLALLGVKWLDDRSRPSLLVLIDRSDSVPQGDAEQALAAASRAARSAGFGAPAVLPFAANPADGPAAELPPTHATDIEAALQAALSRHGRDRLDGVLVISDGYETTGDVARGLRALMSAGLPVMWLGVGRPAPEVTIASVRAPQRAQAGQLVAIGVQLADTPKRPLLATATLRSLSGESTQAQTQVGADGTALLDLDTYGAGPLRLDVAVADAASGQVLATRHDAAVIDVRPAAPVLYVRGGGSGVLARSLRSGGWDMQVVSASRLNGLADQLEAYRGVVLDDVAVTDADERVWRALERAVTQRGIGLLALGGERSFARGGYRGSRLEALLPVLAEPPALEHPASVLFVVDKSGSMGRGIGGVDRFQMAQRAVIDSARDLGPQDAMGLIVFDATPSVLVPLGAAAPGVAALQRAWPTSPAGGTRLAPALDSAIDALERGGQGRRMMVLVTDGAVDEAPLVGLRPRLERARIETVWLAVGPDADVAALERVIGQNSGVVLRVAQAAELPLAMRSGIERRRARIERGSFEVQQSAPLPFAPGTIADWPPVKAYAVTRLRPDARGVLRSDRGDPLLALQATGQGRVAALTCGVGAWSAPWLRWHGWPSLAGGLAGWIAGAAGQASVTVHDDVESMRIDIEVDAAIAGDAPPTMQVGTPEGRTLALPVEASAPGRWTARVPVATSGLYRVALTWPQGTQRALHLRRQHAEGDDWGINPALAGWRATGWVADWDAQALARRAAEHTRSRPPDRGLVALALALALGGVLIDRWPAGALRTWLPRLRTRWARLRR